MYIRADGKVTDTYFGFTITTLTLIARGPALLCQIGCVTAH